MCASCRGVYVWRVAEIWDREIQLKWLLSKVFKKKRLDKVTTSLINQIFQCQCTRTTYLFLPKCSVPVYILFRYCSVPVLERFLCYTIYFFPALVTLRSLNVRAKFKFSLLIILATPNQTNSQAIYMHINNTRANKGILKINKSYLF